MDAATREFYRRFGRRLAWLRKKAQVSQLKLAEFVGLSRTSITNIERGRQPVQLHTLYSMASALREDPPELLPAIPNDSPLRDKIAQRIENLTPQEERELEGLGHKEKNWLKEIAGPTQIRKKVRK